MTYKVLGIDPGLANTGYGLVIEQSGRMAAGPTGTIRTGSKLPMTERLDRIYCELKGLIEDLGPDVVVLEQLFFNTNQKSAIAVSQAVGVILLACAHSGVIAEEYTPLQVKMAVVGNGRAVKDQVAYMVCALLGMSEQPPSLHACDAYAMAICHLQSRRMRELTGE